MNIPVFKMLADFEAAREDRNWRGKVGWPVPYHTSRSHMFLLVEEFNDFIANLDDEDARDVVILASTTMFPHLAWLVHTAVAVEAEAQTGGKLIGAFGELELLRGNSTEILPESIGSVEVFNIPSLAWLRRVKITKSWNSLREIPSVLFKPQATVLSTNDLLINSARVSRLRIDFQYAEHILNDARQRSSHREFQFDIAWLVESLARNISNSALMNEDFRFRLKTLLITAMTNVMVTAAQDLAALKQYHLIPKVIWSGTGAKYLVRALGLETLRRGGEVHRFGHGGSAGMNDYDGLFALSDLAATSHYVAESGNIARHLRDAKVTKSVKSYRRIKITSSNEPSGFEYLKELKTKPRNSKPKVIYVATATRGRFLQGAPPQLPDVVYVDWQIRFAEMLKLLPIDLLCKPHPHGLFHGIRHPVEDVATVSYRRFEEVMEDGDVFVFDAIQSTAFWEAICTDKPVVALGFGQSGFAPIVSDMMSERCRILSVKYDEWNRPQVDKDELREVILSKPYTYDSSQIVNLMTGT